MTVTAPLWQLAALAVTTAAIAAVLAVAAIVAIHRSWVDATPRRQQWLHSRRNRPTVHISLHSPIRVHKVR